MTDYCVKLRFWLCAYESTTISAATDAEAYHLAKAAAADMMNARSHPEEIDLEERREGLISYIDRLGHDRRELAEAVTFDGNSPLHADAQRLIARIALLDAHMPAAAALAQLKLLVAEARAIPTDAATLAKNVPGPAKPWSPDQIYEYRGDPRDFSVVVIDETTRCHALDPRLDLRNHSPTGFAWGYPGSGPAQLALAILCHALNSDERATALYQEFKDAMIAPLGRAHAWHLTTGDVLGWVLKHPTTSAIASGD